MTAASAIERIAATHAAIAPRLAGGQAWARRRGRALATLTGRGLPDRRDENWKYLDHARLAGYPFDGPGRVAVTAAELAGRAFALTDTHRLVLVDGRYEAGLSDAVAGTGIEIEDLATLLERDPEAAQALVRTPGDDADDRYALLADAFAGNGLVIRVAAGAEPRKPLSLLHVTTAAAPAAHHACLVIEVGAGAKFVLVEQFIALGNEPSLGNLAAELAIGPQAAVTHLRIHRPGAHAAQVETWVTRQAEGSRYDQQMFALAGPLLRSNLRLTLDGRAAECRLSGLVIADAERQVDIHTRVDHHGAATRTQQDFRGVANGRGRGAFNGRIVVHPGARGADASQSSRNLLLSPLAEINARPQLEIHVDDVQCRHGATVGTHDPEQLFYLLSRGLDPVAAADLLTFAFCQDLIGRLPLPELRAAIEAAVAGSLGRLDLIRGTG